MPSDMQHGNIKLQAKFATATIKLLAFKQKRNAKKAYSHAIKDYQGAQWPQVM